VVLRWKRWIKRDKKERETYRETKSAAMYIYSRMSIEGTYFLFIMKFTYYFNVFAKESKELRETVCVCVCVRERDRERQRVETMCVCEGETGLREEVCEREDRERESV
jgi:hypothetical protein